MKWVTFGALQLVVVAIGLVCIVFSFVNELTYGACGSDCDFSASQFAILGPVVAIGVSVVGATIWALIRSRRGRGVWWIPFIGLFVVLATTFVGAILIYRATGITIFG